MAFFPMHTCLTILLSAFLSYPPMNEPTKKRIIYLRSGIGYTDILITMLTLEYKFSMLYPFYMCFQNQVISTDRFGFLSHGKTQQGHRSRNEMKVILTRETWNYDGEEITHKFIKAGSISICR